MPRVPGKEDKAGILFFCVTYFIIVIIIIPPGTVKTEWELIDCPIDSLGGCIDSLAN